MAGARRGPNWLLVYAVAYMVFLYAPVVLLPLFAFNDATIVAFPLSGFTTKWFTVLWETEALHGAVRNSLIVAVSSALIATMLGASAARAMARYRFPAKKGIVGFIMLPLVLPEIIVAVALLVMLMQLGLSLSLWTVVAGHVLICTPFAIAILSSAFQGLDQSLEEASLDLGESRWGTFRRATCAWRSRRWPPSTRRGGCGSRSSSTVSALYSMTSSASSLRISKFGMLRTMNFAVSIDTAVRSARRAAPPPPRARRSDLTSFIAFAPAT